MNRREFIAGAASVAGSALTGGCRMFGENENGFYGPTVRDRLWMWGHHPKSADSSGNWAIRKGVYKSFKWQGPLVDQAEGCRMMGIPNDFVVRWTGRPKYPWGDYFEQFRSLRRFAFDLSTGEGKREAKLDIAVNELKPSFPNFTGCVLDDYFLSMRKGGVPDIRELKRISERVHRENLRLSVVAYADDVGLKPEIRPHFELVDEVTFWFSKKDNIPTMAGEIPKAREFMGEKKDFLLGLYMWDYFTRGEPVAADLMASQLATAHRMLKDGVVQGLVFHPSYMAALDVPAVNLSKAWIAEHGEERI